jgi:hypothetical protein
MKISSVKVDAAQIEQGTWIGDIPEFGNVRLLVRGWNNLAFRAMQSRLMAAVPRAERKDKDKWPAIMDRINAQCMRETILLGWENIEDDQGNPIPFSKELAGQWLEDPDMRPFFDAVMWAAMEVGKDQAEDTEELEKNSGAPSATS